MCSHPDRYQDGSCAEPAPGSNQVDTIAGRATGADIPEPSSSFPGTAPGAVDTRTREPAVGGAPAGKKTRRKLWELPHKLHCPVIGTCLDAGELRRIARNAGITQDHRATDYEIHVSFVAAADDRNALSLAAHKAMEKKFAAQVRRFGRARDSAQLASLWDEAVARGEVAAALWATLTHPKCDTALRMRTFEEVHMLSHQVGAGQGADLRRLAEAEDELVALQRDFDGLLRRSRLQLEERERRLRLAEQQLAECEDQRRRLAASGHALQHELAELRAHQASGHLERLERDLARQGRLIAENRREADQWRRVAADAVARAAGLGERLQEASAEIQALERLLAAALSPCRECDSAECESSPDLGGRRILCVGGRNRLVEQYRELVARCNGRFEHYDGGLEDNRQRLDALLSAADAVVCATDCVSHDAYYRLKRFCKRHAKPHVFINRSGISSFARALCSMPIEPQQGNLGTD